ncbi:hypothetical protein [Elongatibacter sediminis]|uniref:Uncharacterized protein n=1 Tax=Elongatibacter sediminis TaxID=3119006 RepID=A0AAW9R9F1_9GAMM
MPVFFVIAFDMARASGLEARREHCADRLEETDAWLRDAKCS